MILHPIPPVFDSGATVLLLGSFPSVRSREEGFYYAHPQNRFWRVLSLLTGEELPLTVPEKKAFLLRHGIALWDVIASCEITGSADQSIRNAVPNDLSRVLSAAPVRRIYLNGGTAARCYERFGKMPGFPEAIALPSTSPANAAWSLPRLKEAWKVILEEL